MCVCEWESLFREIALTETHTRMFVVDEDGLLEKRRDRERVGLAPAHVNKCRSCLRGAWPRPQRNILLGLTPRRKMVRAGMGSQKRKESVRVGTPSSRVATSTT